MRTAIHLQQQVTQYRQLCQEIEWIKHRIVGGSYPVESRRWKSWKAKQARQKHVAPEHASLSELSDNPHYQQLVKLNEQITDIRHNIIDYAEDYQADEAFLDEVAVSFPSLKKRIDPSFRESSLAAIICEGEFVHPQAFHAAVFVDTLQSVGRCRHKCDPIFYIDRAFEVWDQDHREVFVRWLTTPCFPTADFLRLSVDPPTV